MGILRVLNFGNDVPDCSQPFRLLREELCCVVLEKTPSKPQPRCRSVQGVHCSHGTTRRVPQHGPLHKGIAFVETAGRMRCRRGEGQRGGAPPQQEGVALAPVFDGGARPTHSSPPNTHLRASCLGCLQSRA